MTDHFEAVEKLVNKFGITYTEAKDALEAADWDMLDAVMVLERTGKIKSASATYTTTATGAAAAAATAAAAAAAPAVPLVSTPSGQYYEDEATRQRKAAEAEARKARRNDLFGKVKAVALDNHVLVKSKTGKTLVRVPLVAAVVIAVLFFWVLIFAILVAFLCGCQLVFEGPQLGKDGVNKAAKVVGDTVVDLSQDLKEKIEESKAKKDASQN